MKTIHVHNIPKVISGFPGIGKSQFFRDHPNVSDSDSSKFDKSGFPANCLAHIKQKLADRYIRFVLVSSHQEVRNELVEARIPFLLVYPEESLKGEYMNRYAERGSPTAFMALMDNRWDEFVAGCRAQKGCEHRVLGPNQFLSDII